MYTTMYNNMKDISLRPQYLGKRNWKLGCFVSNNHNHLKLLSENNFENNINITNTNNNTSNNTTNNTNDFLKFNDNAFYNKTIEYNKTIPDYIEQYNECNYELLNNISYLYRNLLNSNDFDKIYIKKNSLKQFNNISKIATNKLHKTTLPDNTDNTTNAFNILLKNNQKIIDDNKFISSKSFVDEDYVTNNKSINNDDYSDDYDLDQDEYCESSSYPKDDLDF
jgi:hypothetical protein